MPDTLSVVQTASAALALTVVLLAVVYITAILLGAATVTAVVVTTRPIVLGLLARRRAAQLFTELRGLGIEVPLARTRSRQL
ncbi:MAG TPA: hypothetical protein VIL55_06805 [Naasia sp.]|jgi:hypothetical protein